MCRAIRDGGQRCAAHTRPAFLASTPGTAEWDDAAAAYASTPTGARELIDRMAAAAATGDVETEVALRTALSRGGQIAEANRATAESVSAATTSSSPQPLSTLNPSDHGIFEDYVSGREYRATAPLAPNMTTLAETEGLDVDDPVALYRGVPFGSDGTIHPGDFVTTNPQLARDYTGASGFVIAMKARAGDVLDDLDEPGGEEYIFRPARTSSAGHPSTL